MSYDSSNLKEDDLVLVVDLGGGTSDFSLLRKK
jgi:molecular chaperone DnaK (HSP70)